MRTDRAYALLSWIADFYFLALAIGVIAGLYEGVVRQSLPIAAVFALPILALLGSIWYHVYFARRTRWLSPGEQMHGRVVAGDEKQWTNPWGRNRWALFTLNLIALVLLGNTWDGLGENPPLTIQQTVFNTAFAALVGAGIIAVGKGHPLGALGPAALYLSGMVGLWRAMSSAAARGSVMVVMLGLLGLALLHLVTAWTYAYLRRRDRGAVVG